MRVIWITATSDLPDASTRSLEFVGDITNLGEYVGTGYPTTFATKYAIGTETVTEDLTDHDQKLSTSEGILNKTGIGDGSSEVVGFLFYKQGTSYADSPLLGYADLTTVSEEFTPSGGAVNTTWDLEGIIKLVAKATTA